MNKIFKLTVFILVVGAMFSCDMDRFPYSSIAQNQSMQSIKDAKSWDNGTYTFFRGRQYGIYTFSQDVQADELNASLDFGNRNGPPHVWTRFTADDYTIRDTWQAYYAALTNVNFLINAYPTLEEVLTKDDEKKLLNQYRGNAHFARAFYYNELALRWSKAYNPATAGTDLSVPIVKEYDISLKPSRATLKEVYELILDDLSKAKTFLADENGTPKATRFNKDVVTAMEARVKLYMQDWKGAYDAANSLITSNTYPLETTSEGMTKLWVNDNSNEVILQLFVDKPSELPLANSIYLGYNPTSKKYTPDFVPSKWVVDMFENGDIRKKAYFNDQYTVYIQGQDYKNISLVTKFSGNPLLFTAASTNYMHAPKVFRIAEMYLIAAEAAYKQGGKEVESLKALNALRVARGLSAVNSSSTVLLKDIKDERQRELAFEGFRLFDLKRWGEGFERRAPQNIEMLTTGEDYTSKKVAANADKFVWGIPSRDITNNPSLKGQQNPGW